MNRIATNLLAALGRVNDFGAKYTTNFPPTSVGGKQFSAISAFMKTQSGFGADQVAGGNEQHAGTLSKAVARHHLHDDMFAINHAAHSLALLGTVGIEGKFMMPHGSGAQAYINAARAFGKEAIAYSAQLIEVGLPADFLTHLEDDAVAYEEAIKNQGDGQLTEGGATGGIADTAHQAVISLHILDTIVRNVFKDDAAKLAEWAIARHIERPPSHKRLPPATPTPPTP